MSLELTKDLIERLGEIVKPDGTSDEIVPKGSGIKEEKLQRTIEQISLKQTTLLKYRDVQSFHLTDLKAQILEKIPDKIEDAPLKDLVSAYKVFNDAENHIEGGPKEFKGIVAYLVHIENCEKSGKDPLNDGKVIDIGPNLDEDGVRIPRLK